VLMLDEIGYLPMTQAEASLFFRRINRCYERASTILSCKKSFVD
jgi:DNA replication protein DnaC